MNPEKTSPSTTLKAFRCPHCLAFTSQTWRRVAVTYADKDTSPFRIRDVKGFKESYQEFLIENKMLNEDLPDWIDRIGSGLPSIGDRNEKTSYTLDNVDVSECFHCEKIAIWVGDSIVWPRSNLAPSPNEDMPEDIKKDYKEAGEIVDSSPRGAAALLRLCIQKLCIHLGESGKNIYDDIGSLVAKGVDVRVQKMMDTLRVIGNNAVHPSEMDFRDDRELADKLFSFVNMIVDITITQPKSISEMYGRLGASQIKAIEQRDKI